MNSFSAIETSMNCMTAVIGKSASSTGRVLVAHDEDDSGRTVNRHGYVPAMDWPEGTCLPAEKGLASIPQVPHTLGYYWSQVRGANGGYTSSDTFFNEKGVCLVSNSAGLSKETDTSERTLKNGGIGYNLRRIVAERAVNAKNALNIIISLVNEWGYAPSGRIYTVADASEAYMIQLVRGHHYVAARVPDGAIAVMPNHYTFHTLTDVPNMFYSSDIVSYAMEMGWYTPAALNDFSDFDFAKAYQAQENYRQKGNTLRQKYGTQRLLGGDHAREEYPFCVPATHPVTVRDLMDFLALHYEDTPDDIRTGPGLSPHSTANRRICTFPTIEGTVFDLKDVPALTTVWTACGRPCQIPFIPLHPLMNVPKTLDAMADSAKEMSRHLNPLPNGVGVKRNGWQKMRTFSHLLEMVYSDAMPAWSKRRAAMERYFMFLDDTAVSVQSAKTLKEIGDKCTREVLDVMDDFSQYILRQADIRPVFAIKRGQKTVNISFIGHFEPIADTLIFGMGGLDPATDYLPALPDTFKAMGDNRYEAEFTLSETASSMVAGKYDFYLGGKCADGHPFTASVIVTVS